MGQPRLDGGGLVSQLGAQPGATTDSDGDVTADGEQSSSESEEEEQEDQEEHEHEEHEEEAEEEQQQEVDDEDEDEEDEDGGDDGDDSDGDDIEQRVADEYNATARLRKRPNTLGMRLLRAKRAKPSVGLRYGRSEFPEGGEDDEFMLALEMAASNMPMDLLGGSSSVDGVPVA